MPWPRQRAWNTARRRPSPCASMTSPTGAFSPACGNASTSTVSPGRAYGTYTAWSRVSAIPSPRWPIRAIASRSVTPRPEQELAIAFAAEHRRRQETRDLPAERGDEIDDFLADARLDRGIADDPLFDARPPGRELRLDQRNERGGGSREPQRTGKHPLERDEAHVDDDEIRRLREAPRIERADVGLLERDHVGPLAQPRVELIAADVERIDEPCSTGEQHIGESAGRGADVEAHAAARIDAEVIERRRELWPAARHPGVRGA